MGFRTTSNDGWDIQGAKDVVSARKPGNRSSIPDAMAVAPEGTTFTVETGLRAIEEKIEQVKAKELELQDAKLKSKGVPTSGAAPDPTLVDRAGEKPKTKEM